jgi:hypothetical protein
MTLISKLFHFLTCKTKVTYFSLSTVLDVPKYLSVAFIINVEMF